MPKKAKNRMKKAEKSCVYVCDVCGCEIVCTTPSKGPYRLLRRSYVLLLIGLQIFKNLNSPFLMTYMIYINTCGRITSI
jgi:hypothetical protein